MTPATLISDLTIALPNKCKILITGAPGIGKSDIVAQAAGNAGFDIILMHPSISDPTDFKGLPAIVNSAAEFLPYGQLRKLINASTPTACFIDDIGQAPDAVQAALMQLLQAREIDGHKISDEIVFVGATNSAAHMAGVRGILEPVKSRWDSIIELQVSVEEWCAWAMKKGLPEEVVAFVHFRGMDAIHKFAPTREIKNSVCPRTVASAAKLWKAGLRSMENLSGATGEGWAVEFLSFARCYASMPDPDDCFAAPHSARVPQGNDVSTLYAISVALSMRLKNHNISNGIVYLDRLPTEYSIMAVKAAVDRDPDLMNTPGFTNWAVKNSRYLS